MKAQPDLAYKSPAGLALLKLDVILKALRVKLSKGLNEGIVLKINKA